MTGNFSNNPKQQIFRAAIVPELNSAHYRAPEIESQIDEALRFSENELADRLAIKGARAEKYLRAETLIALLMLARAENSREIENSICLKLAHIVENLLRKFLSARNLNENFIDEAVGELVGEFFGQILGRAHPSYDFWEVNFFVSLQRLTKSYLRKHETKERLTGTFSESSGDETDNPDFEDNLKSYENLTLEQKLEIKQILGKMPDEHRRIFRLYYIEDWTQEQIAEVIGISARTVRTRLKAIAEFLRNFRASGGGK